MNFSSRDELFLKNNINEVLQFKKALKFDEQTQKKTIAKIRIIRLQKVKFKKVK